MDPSQPPSIADVLTSNVSRDLVLALEEALEAGARRAFQAAQGMHDGHFANVLGQMRHFHSNEAFEATLEHAGAPHSQLRGNDVVVGRAGIVRLARFNSISGGPWNNARRSRVRRELSEANRILELLVQPSLLESISPITTATAFFVSVFSGSPTHSPERPLSIEIAVPNSSMTGWLFREPVSKFVARYNPVEPQQDLAHPVLKAKVAHKDPEE